jgi:REP element-mobilizing transposase RayT
MLTYNHHSHCKYSIKMHFVFCTKYRRNILNGQFAEDIKDLIVLHTTTRGYAIDTIEVDGDHLPLWSDGYFVASTGQASTDTIRRYIEEQG